MVRQPPQQSDPILHERLGKLAELVTSGFKTTAEEIEKLERTIKGEGESPGVTTRLFLAEERIKVLQKLVYGALGSTAAMAVVVLWDIIKAYVDKH